MGESSQEAGGPLVPCGALAVSPVPQDNSPCVVLCKGQNVAVGDLEVRASPG